MGVPPSTVAKGFHRDSGAEAGPQWVMREVGGGSSRGIALRGWRLGQPGGTQHGRRAEPRARSGSAGGSARAQGVWVLPRSTGSHGAPERELL